MVVVVAIDAYAFFYLKNRGVSPILSVRHQSSIVVRCRWSWIIGNFRGKTDGNTKKQNTIKTKPKSNGATKEKKRKEKHSQIDTWRNSTPVIYGLDWNELRQDYNTLNERRSWILLVWISSSLRLSWEFKHKFANWPTTKRRKKSKSTNKKAKMDESYEQEWKGAGYGVVG